MQVEKQTIEYEKNNNSWLYPIGNNLYCEGVILSSWQVIYSFPGV